MHRFVEWLIYKFGFRRMQKAYEPVRHEPQPKLGREPGQNESRVPGAVRRLPTMLLLFWPFASSALAQISGDSPTSLAVSERQVPLAGQSSRAGLDPSLQRMNLTAMWRANIQLPLESGSIVSTHLWAVPSEKRTYAELTLPVGLVRGNRTFRASADRIGDNGEPIGIDNAKKEVEIAAARALGRFSNITPVEVTLPVIYLVIVTSDGNVQSFDAESGKHLWSNSGDSVRFPAAPASVSDAGVMVAHGTRLYLYDWKTGKSISRTLDRASCSGVALSGDVAFVSSLSGQVAAYRFNRETSEKIAIQRPWQYRLFGRSISPPAASDRSQGLVAFSTSSGVVTVLSALKRIEPWFNFDAHTQLAGPIGFNGNALYCGDITGQVNKIIANRLGRVEWRAIVGSYLSATPIVVDNRAYLVTNVGDLHCLDDSTGRSVWTGPALEIQTVLAVSNGKVYCRTKLDQLVMLDGETGERIAQTNSAVIGTDLVNIVNDRLYLISSGGLVTCLRQSGNEFLLPKFHTALPASTDASRPKSNEAIPMENAPADAAESAAEDPFGAGQGAAMTDDPLGSPATQPADATDPFATPASP